MLSLREPKVESLRKMLSHWANQPLSYRPADLPKGGFIADEHRVRLGTGQEAYAAAKQKLDAWVMFPQWARIIQATEGQQASTLVAMVVRICGLWWINPCRILRRHDGAMTHGFTYGTLPEHAECGEEMFLIEMQTDGSVWYVIRAFSRPRHWMAWLAFPLARWWQCRFVRDSQRRMMTDECS
ncbi:MAG: DUF1990 domain-containing protein [Verrucomicrobiaceae bacterium]|nr:DUF1990 domain-containing protein [Verrucomicrobiaceae bacterium]